MNSSKVAGIDVHKQVLMVVVQEVDAEAGPSKRFGTTREELQHLAAWWMAHSVDHVVMESTAQYWKPVWREFEPHFQLHLAQAQSNRAPRGRKHDFGDAQRLARRFLAGELILSYVPEPEQRRWRNVTRTRYQLVRDRVRLHCQMECLLEEAQIKLSSVVADVLGLSGRRILQALSAGETDPVQLAQLGDRRLRCSREELEQALNGRIEAVHQQLLRLYLERLALLDRQIEELEKLAADIMHAHADALARLVQIPGIGLESAHELLAELGPHAAAFASADRMSSWVGVCPGRQQSAEISRSTRSAKGSTHVRRVLVQAAHAAVKTKGSYLQTLFYRLLPKLGFTKAIWAIAHRLCRIIWKILHDGVPFIEFGVLSDPRTRKHLANKHVRALRRLGFHIEINDATV
jgi:transposase